jgi:hypothetical protein
MRRDADNGGGAAELRETIERLEAEVAELKSVIGGWRRYAEIIEAKLAERDAKIATLNAEAADLRWLRKRERELSLAPSDALVSLIEEAAALAEQALATKPHEDPRGWIEQRLPILCSGLERGCVGIVHLEEAKTLLKLSATVLGRAATYANVDRTNANAARSGGAKDRRKWLSDHLKRTDRTPDERDIARDLLKTYEEHGYEVGITTVRADLRALRPPRKKIKKKKARGNLALKLPFEPYPHIKSEPLTYRPILLNGRDRAARWPDDARY